MSSDFKQREEDQVLPTPNDELSCQKRFISRVEEEMPARMELGIKRYGTLLQPFNGRDFMRDTFEELLDLSVYLEGVAAEREAMMELIYEVATTDNKNDIVDLQLKAAGLLRSMGKSPYI